jgi:DNA-binding NarL/FixJ family response regulator
VPVYGDLEQLWPDPDRRDDALIRCLTDVYAYEPPDALTPQEVRVIGALSHGLGDNGAADTLGLSFESVKLSSKLARRKLRAKNTTHACCEALRQGLIR